MRIVNIADLKNPKTGLTYRDEYIKFLMWFRTEIGDETPVNHEYFVDKYMNLEEDE